MPPSNPIFTVDTHIFRELGELLVGRDSTALMELIKNAYDADATEVVVTATDLANPDRARIVIQDNGCGMTAEQFRSGFLRIASRFKEGSVRLSATRGRRYTGSKGIGRLAAHKLARLMTVTSASGIPGAKTRKAIEASIDWQRIESRETLEDTKDEIALDEIAAGSPRPAGTTIALSGLRRLWSEGERARFVAECRAYQVPRILAEPVPRRLVASDLLFATPTQREVAKDDPGFAIRLEGDFAEGDDYWDALVDRTDWILEIDASRDEPDVRYVVSPTKATKKAYREAERREFRRPHPKPTEGPFFQARVFLRDEQIRGSDAKALAGWARRTSGVRVYLEGFRVLPYGEPDDDWLRINTDAVRRSWDVTEGFDELFEDEDGGPTNWQQFGSPNSSFIGAVLLTQANAPSLQVLVNREGFAADDAFHTLVTLVRLGIDLLTRTRAAGKHPELERRRNARLSVAEPPVAGTSPTVEPAPVVPITPSTPPTIAEATARVTAAVEGARRALTGTPDPVLARQQLDLAQAATAVVASAAERDRDAAAVFRVLASVGTQMAHFVHEIRGLLGTAVAVHEAIGRLREVPEARSDIKQRLNESYASLGDLRRQIERQAAYLVDVTSLDARRRRSRQKLAERFDAAARLVGPAIDRREITLTNDIPPAAKSPPMFPAELTTVFSNLLSNAVKAAGNGGTIRARGAVGAGAVTVVVENTGVAVDLADAERWFRPFESTTTEIDAALGQGMGLGLTITRDMLEQYGATIRFVPPAAAFATAVEIRFPE